MKKLLIILSFVLFSLNANARDIGTLYKNCKVFQTSGFDFQNLTPAQSIPSISCFMYFRALADAGTRNCIILTTQDTKNLISNKVLHGLAKLTANADIISGQGIVKVITSFINFSENNTHHWEEIATTFNDRFLSNNFPCNIN
tara:strand:- start:1112 stop:1540 length:429 start_codon:yes stop_codon:yes gene_type:complete